MFLPSTFASLFCFMGCMNECCNSDKIGASLNSFRPCFMDTLMNDGFVLIQFGEEEQSADEAWKSLTGQMLELKSCSFFSVRWTTNGMKRKDSWETENPDVDGNPTAVVQSIHPLVVLLAFLHQQAHDSQLIWRGKFAKIFEDWKFWNSQFASEISEGQRTTEKCLRKIFQLPAEIEINSKRFSDFWKFPEEKQIKMLTACCDIQIKLVGLRGNWWWKISENLKLHLLVPGDEFLFRYGNALISISCAIVQLSFKWNSRS